MNVKFTIPTLLKNKKNFKNAIYYFGGSIIQLIFAFFSQPIYSKYLSAEDFGILGYYASIEGIFIPFFIFGMTQYYLMNYFRQSEAKNKKFLFSILANLSVINIIFSVVGFFILQFGFRKFDINVPFLPFSIFLLIILYFNIYLSFLLINLRVRKNGLSYLLFASIPPVLNVVFGLFFVIQFEMGAAGKMLGQVTTNTLVGIISIFVLRRYVTLNIDFSFLRKSFRYILPIIGASFAYFPIRNIDKIYLERLNDISELGYYSIGLRAANFINMASFALFIAFEPDIYKYVAKNQFSNVRKIGLLFMSIVLVFVILFISISPYLLEFLTSGRYTRAYKYANINAIGVVFFQLFGFFNAILIALKRTDFALYINIIGGVSAIVLYKLLINYFSFYGANYAYILVAIIMSISAIFFFFHYKRLHKEENICIT